MLLCSLEFLLSDFPSVHYRAMEQIIVLQCSKELVLPSGALHGSIVLPRAKCTASALICRSLEV